MILAQIMAGDWWRSLLILLIYPGIIGCLDVWLILTKRRSITSGVRRMTRTYPFMAFLFGALVIGLTLHFFLYG